MSNDPSRKKSISALPATWETLDSGGESPRRSPFDELVSLLTLAHMRLRRERVVRNYRSSNVGKLPVSRSSRQVSLDDVAPSAKLATGDGGIWENERSEA